MRGIISSLCILLMVGAIYCSKKNQIRYKKIFIKKGSVEYISRDIPCAYSLERKGEQIFMICNAVYEINLRKKTEKLLFKDGVGPDEVLNPNRINSWDGDFYINSFYQTRFVYKFNPDSQKKEIERVNLGRDISIDDFGFISKNLMVMANVYWNDGLVQIYDREKNTLKKIGAPTFVQAMLKFNVNAAIFCIADDMIYLVEKIKPEIKVISASQAKNVKSLILAPPFYIPMPSMYTPKKYDEKAHREWMASWTNISDIMVNNGWLLVQYKWGYDFVFGYEMIKLDNPDNRYYIAKTSKNIYDFSMEGKTVKFYFIEESGEGDLKWQTADVSIQ